MTDEVMEIAGKQISLSDGRYVFVSERDDGFFIEFRSAEGSITRLALSGSATLALRALTTYCKDEIYSDAVQAVRTTKSMRLKSRWQIVPAQDA